MSWLRKLIDVLDTEEKNTVLKISLRGKEKQMMHLYLNYSSSENYKEEILDKMGITETHFYKINSVLIEKILSEFDQKNILKRVHFLNQKEFYSLLKTEVLLFIKKNNKRFNDPQLALELFRKCIDLPFNEYDEKLVDKAGVFYLESLGKTLPEHREYIFYHTMLADCNRFASKKNSTKYFRYTEAELLEFEKKINKKYHLAHYYLLRTILSYYTYYFYKPELQIKYIDKAIQLKPYIKHHFPIDLDVFFSLLKADVYYSNYKFSQSLKIYNEAFRKKISKETYGYFYHCEQYILNHLIAGNNARAAKLIVDLFENDNTGGINHLRYLLTKSKFYLNCKDFKEANSLILKAYELNQKSVFLPFEIQIKVLENMLFYLKKDFEFCKFLAIKNLNYFKTNKGFPENYLLLFKTIKLCCIQKIKKATISKNTMEIIEQLNEKLSGIFPHIIINLNK